MEKNKLLFKIFALTILFFTFSLAVVNFVNAGNPVVNPPGNQPANNTNSVTLTNPLTSDDPAVIIGNIIKGILGLTGVIALAAFVAGGVIWMTSGGNAEKVKKGRDILVWAVIGLFIVFSSYSILRYVFDVLA